MPKEWMNENCLSLNNTTENLSEMSEYLPIGELSNSVTVPSECGEIAFVKFECTQNSEHTRADIPIAIYRKVGPKTWRAASIWVSLRSVNRGC